MGMIAEVEDGIIEICAEPLAGKVREVEQLPGSWSIDTLRRILQRAPAVYTVWLGGRGGNDTMATIDARWGVYVVTNQPRGEARRRGSAQEIGAYEILETIVPRLHGRTVAGRGTLNLDQVEHLVDEAVFEMGATVYAATFSLASLVWPPLDPAELAAFETYSATHKVGGDDDPDAYSHAEPEQEE